MSKNSPKPECLSILVCDDIFRDQATNKTVIVGTFNHILAQRIPCVHQKMVVLFTLTDAQGDMDLSLSIEHESTGNRILQVGGPLKIQEPLAIHDFDVILQGVQFPEAGKYWIVLEADGEILKQRPIYVKLLEQSSEVTG